MCRKIRPTQRSCWAKVATEDPVQYHTGCHMLCCHTGYCDALQILRLWHIVAVIICHGVKALHALGTLGWQGWWAESSPMPRPEEDIWINVHDYKSLKWVEWYVAYPCISTNASQQNCCNVCVILCWLDKFVLTQRSPVQVKGSTDTKARGMVGRRK